MFVCVSRNILRSSGSEKSRFEKKKRKKKVSCMRTDASWTNWGRVDTSNANPFCWASAESLSTVSATTDSYGTGDSKVGAAEREGTGDGVEQKCTRAEARSTSH